MALPDVDARPFTGHWLVHLLLLQQGLELFHLARRSTPPTDPQNSDQNADLNQPGRPGESGGQSTGATKDDRGSATPDPPGATPTTYGSGLKRDWRLPSIHLNPSHTDNVPTHTARALRRFQPALLADAARRLSRLD